MHSAQYKLESPEFSRAHDTPENAIGDVRWTGSTALHGALISGQIGIVLRKYAALKSAANAK